MDRSHAGHVRRRSILKITNLTKSFGPIQALRGVDFELRRGEIHASPARTAPASRR